VGDNGGGACVDCGITNLQWFGTVKNGLD
jgi:hypothetical protein